jgi:hypothetical protein
VELDQERDGGRTRRGDHEPERVLDRRHDPRGFAAFQQSAVGGGGRGFEHELGERRVGRSRAGFRELGEDLEAAVEQGQGLAGSAGVELLDGSSGESAGDLELEPRADLAIEPRGHQPVRREDQVVEAHVLAARGVRAVAGDAHQPAKHPGELGLNLGPEPAEDLVRPGRQRPLQPAQRAVSLEREPVPARGSPIVKLVEQELEQRQVDRPARALEPDQLGNTREPVIELAPERGDHPDAALAKRLDQPEKPRAIGGPDPLEREGLFKKLVDHQHELRRGRRWRQPGPEELVEHLLGLVAEQPGDGVDPRGPGQLGKRRRPEERCGQAIEEPPLGVAGPDDRAPPARRACDHPRARQHRHQPRPDQRRLAAARRSQHHQERPLRRRLLAKRGQGLADRTGPAEEDSLMFKLERLKAAKWRSAGPGGGGGGLGAGSGGSQPGCELLDQRLQVGLEPALELLGVLDLGPRAKVLAVARLEPPREELANHRVLPAHLFVVRVAPLDGVGLGGLLVDHQLALAVAGVGGQRPLELMNGARNRRGAVGQGQRRAQPRPQDADEDLGLRRDRNLVLKRARRPHRQVFPEDHAQVEAGMEAGDPVDHPLGDPPLLANILG